MSLTNPNSFRNLLLASLDDRQLALLRPRLEPVALSLGTLLEEPGTAITHVHFPEAGIGSVMVLGPGGQRVEAGLFGREGMSGLAVVLGDELSLHRVVVQVAGHGHRVRTGVLREAMRADGALREVFLRYALAVLGQTASTVLANARLSLEARLARWLLMCHDRVDGDDLLLTHEFMALMLGVRRAGVTVAVHMLEGRGLIRATRGHIHILHRGGLEVAARGLYGLAEAEYARLVTHAAAPQDARAARATTPP